VATSPKNRRVQNRVGSVRAAGQQRFVAYLEEALCRFTRASPRCTSSGAGPSLTTKG
jgi:hypothetical protein